MRGVGRLRRRHSIEVLITMAALLVGSCSTDEGSRGSGMCAFVVHFRGHAYDAVQVSVEPIPGRSLGEAVLPGCNDTGDASPKPDEYLEVAELPGVDPNIAVVWSTAPDRIFVRQGLDALPPEVAQLVHAPPCDPQDAPLLLHGPWLGILGANGETELDLLPPYDIGMLVQQASAPGYERSHLKIRVPESLGRPLTHEDVESSLWKGGTISVTATCVEGGFVAQQVEAFPPA